jgi:uncharacterized iron-regulated membrane protein
MANKNKGYTFRKFIRDIHLWLGVGSGLILFLVCLSGTVYTFRHEIEEAVEPAKYRIENPEGNKVAAQQIIDATQQKTKGTVSRISIYDDAAKPYELQVSMSEEDKRGETYYVNPFKNEILGTGKGPTTEFFMTFFKLHRWLLFDEEIGRPIVGIATLIFVVLTITGLFLWLPKKIKGLKSFKPGLLIKFSANWKRINHDLHNVLGLYTFIIILIMALTGLNWSFEWYKDGMSNVFGAKVFGGRDEKKMTSTVIEGANAISIDSLIAIGNHTFAYQGKTIISLPKDAEGSFELRKQNSENFNRESADKITVDQYSGAILKKELYAAKTLGQKIASQIKVIHIGEIFGTFSKVIYFISCLIATSLPITGVIIWINKLRKPKKKLVVATANANKTL